MLIYVILSTWLKMEKVHLVRGLVSHRTNDEDNLFRDCRNMIIFKYDPLLSYFTIIIVIKYMTVEVDKNTVALTLISHNITDELTNHFINHLFLRTN